MITLDKITDLNHIVLARSNSVFIAQPSKYAYQTIVRVTYSNWNYSSYAHCCEQLTFKSNVHSTKEALLKELATFLHSQGVTIWNWKRSLSEVSFLTTELNWDN